MLRRYLVDLSNAPVMRWLEDSDVSPGRQCTLVADSPCKGSLRRPSLLIP